MTPRALVVGALLLCGLTGCERTMRDMYEQPRYSPGEGSPLFPDGRATRPPPPASVANAMGDLAATSSGRRGQAEVALRESADAASVPPPVTRSLMQRGQERYSIYCLPCHSPVGDGDGPIVRRGFPRPPSYHEQRLREAPDRHFFDVITYGRGIMYPYADRITPEDRWAVVAYIRALQLSQHAPLAALPHALQESLAAMPAEPPAKKEAPR